MLPVSYSPCTPLLPVSCSPRTWQLISHQVHAAAEGAHGPLPLALALAGRGPQGPRPLQSAAAGEVRVGLRMAYGGCHLRCGAERSQKGEGRGAGFACRSERVGCTLLQLGQGRGRGEERASVPSGRGSL